jgi:hypothetical protein
VPLLRRKSTDLVAEAVEDVETPESTETPSAAGSRPKAYTPSKKELGQATPKRKEAGVRRVEPPPANRREAYKRMRDKQRSQRLEARKGMLEGDEKFMLARDRGPVRALARDIVDSRRNVGSYFLIGALVVIVGSSSAMPLQVQYFANMFWLALALAVIVDSVVLTRKVKRIVRERYPNESHRGTGFYAFMRSITFRKMRMPKPRIKIGEKY